ncbi:MAG: YciI family protein [Nitrospiraceae bacterium]
MRYLSLRYEEEAKLRTVPGAEAEAIRAEHLAATEAIQQGGHYCCGEILQPADMAATVRVRNGIAATNGGPFADSKEQLGGFYLIIARDLNEAIQMASKLPSARLGTVEVRPVLEISERQQLHPDQETTHHGAPGHPSRTSNGPRAWHILHTLLEVFA